MTRAACTIVSLNYLPYARVLADSFLRQHPDCRFYVLLVDRIPPGVDLSHEVFELIPVESLGIPEFPSLAFRYDVLELNTNVKPTFLKSLLMRGIEEVVYLDPDILICRPLDSVFGALAEKAIVVTPHALSPNPEDVWSEVIFLLGGVFNLGFIAVRRSAEAERLLAWWEQRCLAVAFNEPRVGMFVDQKWINLLQCFFDDYCILKNAGCNVAFWNLHERELSQFAGQWMVNGSVPLEFFHFSGISVDGGEQISRRANRFTLRSRPDLRQIFEEYRAALTAAGLREFRKFPYAFGSFDNGQHINRLTRALYAGQMEKFAGEDPFSCKSSYYAWARSRGIFSDRDSVNSYTADTVSKTDWRLRLLNAALRVGLRVLGADRYTVLLKYLSHVSTLRNQSDVFSMERKWKAGSSRDSVV